MNNLEIWKDITGYEGLYQISNYGRVKSMNYNHTGKERILKNYKDKDGYLVVHLYKDGKRKTFKVHRLTLTTFNPVSNMESLTVDHISMDKTDNRLSNLRYATKKEQIYFDEQDWKTHAKTVFQYTKSGKFVRKWGSTMDIERELGIDHSKISAYCLGRYKSGRGYIWTYEKRES